MKSKTIFVWAVIAVAVLAIVRMLAGSSSSVDGDLKYSVCDDNSVVVTGACPATVTGDYVIPSRLGGKVVSGIEREAFSHCEGLTSVMIPKGVTSIGRGAFGFCASLKSVEIPEGVTSIGDRAFECCRSLKSVEIPEGVTNVSPVAFSLCTSLESVVVPMSVVEFGDYVFNLCGSLRFVKFGNDVFEFYKPLKDATDGFEKAKDEKFAVECEKLALERLRCTTGGEHIWEAYIQRKNCHSRYDGIESFIANFEQAVPPLSDNMTRANGNLATREELYRKYLNANESFSKRKFGPQGKDEFETEDEYKTRRKNEGKETIELKRARDKALDEIVTFEKGCNPKVFRCSVNDFYVMKEALVFIPKTEWKYDAEERKFGVKGKEFNSDYGRGLSEYVPTGDRRETVQGFRFSANSLPVIQFVKSKSINYKYKVPDGVWEHPRMFKAYKQKHPFLLVHLGLCDFKVKGFQDQVVIMPWSHENPKMGDSNDRIAQLNQKGSTPSRIAGGGISSWMQSALAKLNDDTWCKQQAILDAQEKLRRERKKQITKDRGEALLCKILNDTGLRTNYDPRMDGELLFKAQTIDAEEDGVLVAMGIYADYETAEGRAEIEKVLGHFEETGGAYYRGFSKAVRRAMEREACEGDEDALAWTRSTNRRFW